MDNQSGEWRISYGLFGRFTAAFTTAQEFLDAIAAAVGTATPTFIVGLPTVSPDGTPQVDVPGLGDTISIDDDDHWVRLTTPGAGESYLQWNVRMNTVFTTAGRANWQAEMPVLVGADFALAPDSYATFLFERHTADQTIVSVTDRPVWGELLERGSALGVLDITTADPTTTGSQEEAAAIVRYDAGLAIGTALTDDLARVWTIDGSRTVDDRRYLEFSLSRTVGGV